MDTPHTYLKLLGVALTIVALWVIVGHPTLDGPPTMPQSVRIAATLYHIEATTHPHTLVNFLREECANAVGLDLNYAPRTTIPLEAFDRCLAEVYRLWGGTLY